MNSLFFNSINNATIMLIETDWDAIDDDMLIVTDWDAIDDDMLIETDWDAIDDDIYIYIYIYACCVSCMKDIMISYDTLIETGVF